MEKGTIFKFHNDLDTDQIIASQYLLLPNLDEMKGHAFESLDPDFTLSDAMPLGDIPHLSIIKGDAKSLSIGAASILAKVTRDSIMKEYGKQYPEYGFEKHKGYVTKAHKEALEKYGVTPIHRKSFAPVQKVLNQQLSFDFEEKD